MPLVLVLTWLFLSFFALERVLKFPRNGAFAYPLLAIDQPSLALELFVPLSTLGSRPNMTASLALWFCAVRLAGFALLASTAVAAEPIRSVPADPWPSA